MKVNLSFASDNIFSGNLKNFLKLTIDVSEDKKKHFEKSTKPVFLIPVIDRSGSMSSPASRQRIQDPPVLFNDCVTTCNSINSASSFTYTNSLRGGYRLSKLDCALSATCELLDLLNEGDKFAVVSFDDGIRVEQQPITVSNKNRNEVKSNINRIRTGGCTNISGALETATDLFTSADTEKYNCKIVLLSDGCANVGLDTEKQFVEFMPKILNRSISTSSIGLGDDYDLGIMEAISGNCAGSFNHISDALAIKDIFATELKSAQAIVCKDAIVNIKLPDMVAFKPNYNNYNEEIQKDNICIKLGNLYSNKTIYYEFSVLDEELKEVEIAVSVTYETPDGGKNTATMSRKLPIVAKKEDLVENKDVIDEIMTTVKDRYVYNASKAYSTADYEGASLSFAESAATINSMTACYSCCASTAMDEITATQASLTSSSASQDCLRKAFDNSSKKLRNS